MKPSRQFESSKIIEENLDSIARFNGYVLKKDVLRLFDEFNFESKEKLKWMIRKL